MKKILCMLYFAFASAFLHAQYFHHFNYAFKNYKLINQTRNIFCDTSNGKTYFIGEHRKTIQDTLLDIVLEYDGDSVRPLLTLREYHASSNLSTAVRYQGKLFVGGSNDGLYGGKETTILVYDGVKWDTVAYAPTCYLPSDAYVSAMTVHNNRLYVCGGFDRVGNVPARFAAYMDSAYMWHAIDHLGACPFSGGGNGYFPHCLAFYHDTLYMGGTIADSCDLAKNQLIRYNGSNWEAVPGWQVGFNSLIESMTVYQDKLYISGLFNSADGVSLGNNIVSYDGASWSSPGGGTDYEINSTCTANGKLFVSGRFRYADTVSVNAFASWDGHRWCRVDSKNITITGLTICSSMGDSTIFLSGGFNYIGGDTFYSHAYWTGKLNTYKCGTDHNVATIELEDNAEGINIYPIPSSDRLHLSTPISDLTITDITGRVCVVPHTDREIDISSLPAGVYCIRAQTRDGSVVRRFVKE